MIKNITILCCFLFAFANVQAQEIEVWDLSRCIEYARQHNIQARQTGLSIRQAELNQKQSKLSRMPGVSGSASHTYNFGRSIDPTSNSFESQMIQANNFGLSGNGVIYGGGQIRNSIKQSEYDLQAAQADADRINNDLGLSIAQGYLQVLLAQDQLGITKNRLKQSQDRLARTQTLVNAGAVARVTLLDLEAQIATDEQSIVAAENGLVLAFLSLKTQLNLDPDDKMTISRPNFDMPEEVNLATMTVNALYQEAVKNQPQIQASEYRQESAKTGIDIAKGALKPSLAYFGGLSTNYSNLAQRPTGELIPFVQDLGDVDIDGFGIYPLKVNSEIPVFENNPFTNQLNENLSQNIGLSLNVPIYNKGQNRLNVQRAELSVISAELNTEQLKQTLKSEIQRALTDARAAYNQLRAAEKTLSAREIAFTSAEKRFELGAINTFDYAAAKDALDIAKVNVVSSRYDYVFKLKVLDYYLGKEISL